MAGLFLLSERQMARISPHFPLSHGVDLPRQQRSTLPDRHEVEGHSQFAALSKSGKLRGCGLQEHRSMGRDGAQGRN